MTTETELKSESPKLNSQKRLAGPVAASLVLGLIVGAGATYLFTRGTHEHEPAAEAAAAATRYQCPMHPDYTSDKKGDCPICGMKLVPIENAAAPRAAAAPGGKRTIAFYRSPMNPSQTSPVARKDEMGMNYVPVNEDEVSGALAVPGLAAVQIDAQRQQLIGIRTAVVAVGALSDDWQTVGRIAIDPRPQDQRQGRWLRREALRRLHREGGPARATAAQHLQPRAAQRSKRIPGGAADEEALSAGRELAGSGDDLVAAARRRLELWDIRKAEVDELDPKTRTAKVRLSFANPRGELKPDMFGEVVFHYKSRQGLQVPADSIIDSGERKIVFVALGEARSSPARSWPVMQPAKASRSSPGSRPASRWSCAQTSWSTPSHD